MGSYLVNGHLIRFMGMKFISGQVVSPETRQPLALKIITP